MILRRQLDQSLTSEVQERRGHGRHAIYALGGHTGEGFCEFGIVTRLDDEQLKSQEPRPRFDLAQPRGTHTRVVQAITLLIVGTACFKTSRRLLSKSVPDIDRPVILPPGRARLWTNLSLIGSARIANTIGVLVLAANSARTGC